MFKYMNLIYKKAANDDINLLIHINNEAYYDDYIRYGYCPGYNISIEQMKTSLENKDTEKHIIYLDDIPVGAVSIHKLSEGKYYLANLCIIPQYQHKGIGKTTIDFILNNYSELKELSLVTPADKIQNVTFYTKKCGFNITGNEMDGSVELFNFILKR